VEDNEADGHSVYAEYIITRGTVRTLEDANGDAPGHSAEEAEGCGDWAPAS